MRLSPVPIPFALMACLLAAGSVSAAETYRWLDEKGRTVYGEKPPAGRAAKAIDTTPSGPVGQPESGPARDKPEMDTGRRTEEPRATPTAVLPPQAAPQVRGMEFDIFIRLQRGMSEGELMLRAGRPDYESVENFRDDIVKNYYYYPTVSNPFTTVVTVRGGRISDLDRVKRF